MIGRVSPVVVCRKIFIAENISFKENIKMGGFISKVLEYFLVQEDPLQDNEIDLEEAKRPRKRGEF